MVMVMLVWDAIWKFIIKTNFHFTSFFFKIMTEISHNNYYSPKWKWLVVSEAAR